MVLHKNILSRVRTTAQCLPSMALIPSTTHKKRTFLLVSSNHSLQNFELHRAAITMLTRLVGTCYLCHPSWILPSDDGRSFCFGQLLHCMDLHGGCQLRCFLDEGCESMTPTRPIRHSSWNIHACHHLQARNSSPAGTRSYSSLYLWCLAQCLAMNIQHMWVQWITQKIRHLKQMLN